MKVSRKLSYNNQQTNLFKTMKKIYLIAACSIALLTGCKSTKTIQQETGAVEMKLPFESKDYQTNKDYFRSIGTATSRDLSFSKDKSLLNAKSILSSSINSTLKKVILSFSDEVTINDKQEFQNKSDQEIRDVVNLNMQNVSVIGEKLFKEVNGSYTYYIAVEINKSGILEGMSNKISKNEALKLEYDKMKFEKIFNEEMEKLEKGQ
jgi:hypothetical protein